MSEIMDTLRAAARAYKLELFQGGNPIEDELDNGLLYIDASGVLRCWAPHRDLTDAARLAIKLRFTVSCSVSRSGCEATVTIDYPANSSGLLSISHCAADDVAATCMAITRAAAVIGKSMEVTA